MNLVKTPRLVIFLLVSLLMLPLAGCGSNRSNDAVAGNKEIRHLTMWKFQTVKEDYMIYDWVKQWNSENPHVQVSFELIPYNDYLTVKLPTAFATNSAPDIYMISAGGFLKYAKAGCMLPLDDYIDSDLKKDFYEQSLATATYNGKIMGIPIEREPVALFYSQKAFNDRNLDLPSDWDELEDCIRLLNSDQAAGTYLPIEPSDYQNFIFYSLLMQAGGAFDPVTKTSGFSSSGAKALKLWRSMYNYCYKAGINDQSPPDIYPLATGKTATQICGYWSVKRLEKYYPDFDYGVIPLPYPKDGVNTSVYGGWFQIVNPYGKYTGDAAGFTIWMWGQDTARPLDWCTEASSKFPSRKSVFERSPSIFSSEKSIIFSRDILPYASPEPRYPVEISKLVSKAIQDAMFTDKNIDEIARTAEDGINAYLRTSADIF